MSIGPVDMEYVCKCGGNSWILKKANQLGCKLCGAALKVFILSKNPLRL